MVVQAGARREAVLHELGHQRLGVGQGSDAVADVAGRDDPELLAEAAAAAAIVGDGHDGRDVGAVPLQPPQQRREAGAAADRHDPRPARQVALRVQHLEDAVVAADEGRHDRAHQAPHAEPVSASPNTATRAARTSGWSQAPVSQYTIAISGAAVVAVQVAQEDGGPQPEDHDSRQEQGQPALDVHARVEPAREPPARHRSSSRWKTVTETSGSSPRRCASSSARAIDRWKPPVQPSAIRS